MIQRRALLGGLVGGTTALLAGCSSGGTNETVETVTMVDDDNDMQLTSPAFDDGDTLPQRFTADGADASPPFTIAGVPDGVDSLALIVDDPDAPEPPFTHWLVWAIPPGTTEIPEGIPKSRTSGELDGAKQGTNSFRELGWRGPAPPEGDDPHTYRFTLYAVGESLNRQAGVDREQIDAALQDNIVANERITAEYGR